MLDIKKLAFDHRLDQASLASIMQCTQPTVSYYYTGKRDISRTHWARLIDHFGEDVISSYIVSEDEFFAQPRYSFRTGNAAGSDVAMDNNRIGADIIHEEIEIKETITISPDVINQEGIDLRKGIDEGTIEVEVTPTQDILPSHDARIVTDTDEMSPKIDPNDPVFVRFLPSVNDFEDGRMYLVDLYHGTFIRWVVREDEDHIRLFSMKTERVIPISSVKSLAKVEMIAKRPETLPKDRSSLQEVIALKDTQINAVIDQQGQLIEQQGRLISLIEKQS